MSVSIYITVIEARSDDGDYVEVKLSGMTEALDDGALVKAKQGASDLFEHFFGEPPYEILVHDSMKHRAERDGEGDDG